jgi:hypothetical protein
MDKRTPKQLAVDLAISVAIVVPALAGLLCALEWYAGLWRAAV